MSAQHVQTLARIEELLGAICALGEVRVAWVARCGEVHHELLAACGTATSHVSRALVAWDAAPVWARGPRQVSPSCSPEAFYRLGEALGVDATSGAAWWWRAEDAPFVVGVMGPSLDGVRAIEVLRERLDVLLGELDAAPAPPPMPIRCGEGCPRADEAVWRAMLDAASDAVMLIDGEGQVRVANRAARALMDGLDGLDEQGGLLAPIRRALLIDRALAGERFEQVWTCLDHADSPLGSVFARMSCALAPGDAPIVVCTVQDQTGVIEREEQIRRAVQEREVLGRGMSGLALRVDARGRIIAAERRGDSVWSSLNPALQRKTLMEVQPQELGVLLACAWDEVVEQRQDRRLDVCVQVDGTPCWGEVWMTRTSQREVFVSLRDCTHERHLEELISVMGFAVERGRDAGFWITNAGQITYKNRSARELFEWLAPGREGWAFWDLEPQVQGAAWFELWAELEGAEHLTRELVLEVEGRVRWLELTLNLVRYQGHDYCGAFAHDITDRVLAEREQAAFARRLEQSNRELEEFAYIASHDLQEPLRKIVAFGGRLESNHAEALGERGSDYLSRMTRAASRMSTLIDDLLRFSRVSTRGEALRPCAIADVLDDVLQDLEWTIAERHAEILLPDSPLPEIEADPSQLGQLLLNLLGNAIKFTPPERAPRVHLHAHIEHDEAPPHLAWCVLEVRDEGIGFSTQYAEKIFQPFQRLHGRSSAYKGTGIGLAICRKIVERHGGIITAHSAPDAGATFRIRLPVRQLIPALTEEP